MTVGKSVHIFMSREELRIDHELKNFCLTITTTDAHRFVKYCCRIMFKTMYLLGLTFLLKKRGLFSVTVPSNAI